MKTQEKESLYLELTNLVDAGEWVEAKELITKIVNDDYPDLSKKMMDYYSEYVCRICLGREELVEVSTETFTHTSTKCECQL